MDCSIVQHNLFAYREDGLPPDIKRDFEAHLSECESCKLLLSGFKSMEAVIEKAKIADPNPFVTTRIIQHIEDELTSKDKKRGFVLRPILLTLTVLGAVVLGFTIGKSGYDRISGNEKNINLIENLKTELHIPDFVDENNALPVNE
jgi:predicted anti-sigma-YlaC factor YlaD